MYAKLVSTAIALLWSARCPRVLRGFSAMSGVPVYAVEFKAPHKVTIPELVAGLHEIDLARDVIDLRFCGVLGVLGFCVAFLPCLVFASGSGERAFCRVRIFLSKKSLRRYATMKLFDVSLVSRVESHATTARTQNWLARRLRFCGVLGVLGFCVAFLPCLVFASGSA
jgi:hypothetical protein